MALGLFLLWQSVKKKVIIAGLLHDTLEDTDTTEEDIGSMFGEEVLRLVQGASEPDKTDSWERRKKHTLEFLKSADLAIRQVACADKLHNLLSIRRDVEAHGESIWNKFNRGYEDQKWYYTSLVESLGYASRFSLLDAFQDEVETFYMEMELSAEKKECRRSKKLYDAVFESLFANPERVSKVEVELSKMNLLNLKRSVFEQIERYRDGKEDIFDKKQEMYRYLTSRGIEFEINSEGTDIIISACAALRRMVSFISA